MALTLQKLHECLKEIGLRFFTDPDNPGLLYLVVGTPGGNTFGLYLVVEAEGQLVQLRTRQYMVCPPSHPRLNDLLREIAVLNYRYRFGKLSWDPEGGEVVVYADLVLADSEPTCAQVAALIGTFLRTLDTCIGPLKQTMEGGPQMI
jgi:hypothetical protein